MFCSWAELHLHVVICCKMFLRAQILNDDSQSNPFCPENSSLGVLHDLLFHGNLYSGLVFRYQLMSSSCQKDVYVILISLAGFCVESYLF